MTILTNVIVESVSKNGKSVKVNNEWYGAFNSSQLNGAAVGDTITFEYLEKGQYKNIKGGVSVMAKNNGTSSSTNVSSTSGGKQYNKGNFPIDPLDGQRSIIRQNALTNACSFFNNVSFMSHEMNDNGLDGLAGTVLSLAKRFEAYTAGDLDRMKAMELANKMNGDN